MEMLNKYLASFFARTKDNGSLAILYALLVETLLIGYIFFAGLFTAETLLPTFVTVHLSLAKFLFALVLLTFITSALGRFLDMHFTWRITKKSPLLWLGTFWTIGILGLSLYKFPLVTIPFLIGGFLAVGYLFSKIIFSEEH